MSNIAIPVFLKCGKIQHNENNHLAEGGWSHLPLASDEILWGFALAPGEGRALLRQCKKEHCGFIRRFVALH